MSLLLSYKFIRSIASIARIRGFKGQTCACRQINFYRIPGLRRTFSLSSSAFVSDQNSKLDRSLRRLDQDVRRMGRISKRELEEALEELKTFRSATSTQSLLLIRCCGSLLPEEPSDVRTELVKELLKMLQNFDVPMDISHYNALLRVYLENEHPFSPTEFLADLERKGIEPNRVTYQRLVERYCQAGDIGGATHILEFMQAKQMPVNENIFNSLILGHSCTGDMKSANDILAVMGNAGLEPSAETYRTLLCAYAKHGDIEAVRSTIDKCKESDIQLLDQDLMEVVYALAVNGHDQYVDELIEKFQNTVGFNQEAYNLILKLCNKRKFEVAKKILFTMPRGARDGQLLPSGGFFIKQLVKADCPVEDILSACKELQEQGLNDHGYLIATENCLSQGEIEKSLMLFSTLKEQGLPIKQHYFWPLIISQAKLGNINGVLDTLKIMQEKYDMVVSGETLKDYVVPWLYKISPERTATDLLSLLRSAQIPPEMSVMPLVNHLLFENNIADALHIAREHGVSYSPTLLGVPLIQAYRHTKDHKSFAGLLLAACAAVEKVGMKNLNLNNIDEPILEKHVLIGELLLHAVANLKTSMELKLLLEALLCEGLHISHSTAERVVEKMGNENLTPEISNLLEKLTSARPRSFQQSSSPESFHDSELRLINITNRLKAKGEPLYNVKRQLLSLYCKNLKLEKADAVLNDLLSSRVLLTPTLAVQLIDMYLQCENTDKAMDLLKWLQEHLPHFVLNRVRIVKLATVFIKNHDIEGAINLLNEYGPLFKPEQSTYSYNSACRQLLFLLADKGDVEGVNNMFDCLLQNKYIEVNNVMLGSLVKVHIIRNDLHGAVNKFEELCRKYHSTPLKSELTRKLIETEDATSLQRITDLSTKIHGEVNSLYDLVFTFIECRRVRQARKILETPGLVGRPERVQLACKRYFQEGMVSSLEGLLEATRSLPHINPSDIYLHLLVTYCNKDDAENAMGLWEKMQEENLQPTDEFLNVLGEFLKNKGLTVPFVLPSVKLVTDSVVDDYDKIPKLSSYMKGKKFSQALNLILSLDEFEKSRIPEDELSSLLEELFKSGNREDTKKLLLLMLELNKYPTQLVFQDVINDVASHGDILTLEHISQYLNGNKKKIISYNNNLCRAYMATGKSSEYLDLLEKDIDSASSADVSEAAAKFPRSSIISLLKDNPNLHTQYQRICEKYYQFGITQPYNMLWVFYGMEHQYAAANKIWDQFLFDSVKLDYSMLSHYARQQGDLHLATYVVNQLKKSALRGASQKFAYSCVVDIHVANKSVDEAIRFIEEVDPLFSYDNLPQTTKQNLENLAKEQGITLGLSQKVME